MPTFADPNTDAELDAPGASTADATEAKTTEAKTAAGENAEDTRTAEGAADRTDEANGADERVADNTARAPTTAPVNWSPSYVFLGVIAAVILVLDGVTKWWAETTLSKLTYENPSIIVIEDVLTFTLAYNKGGAFGMLADENDVWRQPFFLLVSVGAVAFIVSLYRRLTPEQRALRWGLPLVLGGALGNLADRLAKGKVVDFVDYRAGWVEAMNELIAKVNDGWHVTSHWPTFNVADMAICAGIGLMAIDMFFARRSPNDEAPPSKALTSS